MVQGVQLIHHKFLVGQEISGFFIMLNVANTVRWKGSVARLGGMRNAGGVLRLELD
jgi:hypothetical protein